MKTLDTWMNDLQEINTKEKGISFTEEAFTQLYDEAMKAKEKHLDELDFAGRNGIVIGAVLMGTVMLGVKGVSTYKKHKLKKKMEEVEIIAEEQDNWRSKFRRKVK